MKLLSEGMLTMKNTKIFRIVVLLSFLLAIFLQPVSGQTTDPGPAPAEGMPRLENSLTEAAGEAEFTPLTISLGGGPDYDSGWVAILPGQTMTVTHNLGGANTDNYWVDLEYRSETSGINQSFYGGADISPTGGQVGAFWRNLTTSTISVTRRANDTFAEKVRVRIWTDPSQMSYFHWNALDRGSTTTFTSVTVDPDNYLIDLRFNDANPSKYGINQRFYGGKDCGSDSTDCLANAREGGNWYGLADGTVSVFRQDEDTSFGSPTASWEQFLTKIWALPKPTYSSELNPGEWQYIVPGTDFTFTHNVGGNVDDYLVDLEYKSADPDIGVNQIYYGGARLGSKTPRTHPIDLGSPGDMVGAYWDHLTPTTINVHRNSEDQYANWVRVRIWSFWKPRQANYDSGWFSTPLGESTKDLSSIGGNASNYLVDFQFKDSSGDINQHNYGTNLVSVSPENRIGAYWSNLTDTSIKLVRAPQDASAVQSRLRIWVMPKPDVDAVETIIPGGHWIYNHNLGGSANNYLVDLEFVSPDLGINQAGFGGFDTGTNPAGADQRVGLYWSKLSNTSIDIYRRQEDTFAATQVRLRMWRMAKPNYDSGLVYAGLGGHETILGHRLFQDPEYYFISTTFCNSNDSQGNPEYNQAFFGGADLGVKEPAIANHKVGAYWLKLTSTRISITKELNDTYAGKVEVRMWVIKYFNFLPLAKN